MKKTLKKYIIPIAIFIIITILYFLIPIIIFPDSVEYYEYLDIFYKIKTLSSWNVVRGFSFPLTLFIFTKIFGNTKLGLLVCSYFFYSVLIITLYIIYRKIINNFTNKHEKYFFTFMYFLILIFNPITFGYSHTLLTEFIAMPLGVLSCLFSYKYLLFKPEFKSKKTYFYLFIYIVLFIYSWFLKQPYFTIALFPLIFVIFLSIFKYKSLKDFLMRISTLLICVLFLCISIGTWKNTLVNAGVDYNNGRNSTSFIKNGIFLGIKNFEIDYYSSVTKEDLETNLIDNKEYEKVKKTEKNYMIVNVYNEQNNLIDKMLFTYNYDDYTIQDTIKFYFKSLLKHPIIVINSYIKGYLTAINIYKYHVTYINNDLYNYEFSIIKEFDINNNHENKGIGLSFLNINNNLEGCYNKDNVKRLYTEINIPSKLKNTLSIYSNIHLILFKLSYLILPFIFLVLIIKYIFKKERTKNLELAVIFLGFALMHTIFHVIFGAIIDRYVYISFSETILGYIFLLMPSKEN